MPTQPAITKRGRYDAAQEPTGRPAAAAGCDADTAAAELVGAQWYREADQRSYDEGTTLTADLDAGVKGDLTLHIEARGTENGVEIEQWYLQRDWEPDEGTKLWDGQ